MDVGFHLQIPRGEILWSCGKYVFFHMRKCSGLSALPGSVVFVLHYTFKTVRCDLFRYSPT